MRQYLINNYTNIITDPPANFYFITYIRVKQIVLSNECETQIHSQLVKLFSIGV